MKKSKSNGIVVQATVLAMAGIISRIIGLLYRSPLNSVIGNLGMGYYQQAYTYYTIVLLISSYSIPGAVSKVISQKLAMKEYVNAHRLFKGAMLYVLIVGCVGSAFLFFGASLFVNDSSAIPILRVFAPTILIYGFLGVFRGYFQAHNSMVQTSISQIVEQIVNAIVSVGMAYFLIRFAFGPGMPTSTEKIHDRAIIGAIGSALGTCLGVIAGLVSVLIMYKKLRPQIKRQIHCDQSTKQDSYFSIMKKITFVVTPFILSTAMYNLSSSINTKVYTDWYAEMKKIDLDTITATWGLFSGQALTISNIPIAFASAMATAVLPSVSTLMATKNMEEIRRKIQLAVKTTSIITMPCAVGLFVLAEPIVNLLFSNSQGDLILAGGYLRILCFSIVFYGFSTLNNGILQGTGKMKEPIYNAFCALVFQTVVLVLLLSNTSLGVYGVGIANTVYAGTLYYLNHRVIKKTVDYKQEYKRSIFLPLLLSVIMGCVVHAANKGLLYLNVASRIATVISIIIGGSIYIVLILTCGVFSKEELRMIPLLKKICDRGKRND